MNGTEKLPVYVIGKSQRPAALRMLQLPGNVIYTGNNKGWMTREAFQHYCDIISQHMLRQNRKILLILDNVASHKLDKVYDNIDFLFLPPNTTSILQPLDQGIIMSFKCHYKKKVVEHDFINKFCSQKGPISLAEAVSWVSSSWDFVTGEVIQNFWKKAGMYFDKVIETAENMSEDLVEDELRVLLKQVYPKISDDAVFGWVVEDEEEELQDNELNNAIEICLDRAFNDVVGESSYNLSLSYQDIQLCFDAIERFLFSFNRTLVYENPSLFEVVSRLENECLDSSFNASSVKTALNDALTVKQYLVHNYGLQSESCVRLSDVMTHFVTE
ncbi:hypothetical protein RCL1_000025 [Eukaryota sp. TZLM3-RCL]